MDFLLIEDLLNEIRDIQMAPIDNVLDILNEQVGEDVYYLSNNKNIYLQHYVDTESMKEKGFESDFSASHLCIESLYPLKIRKSYGDEDRLTIIPNNIPISPSISIESKKQFLINYFTNLKNDIKKQLKALDFKESTVKVFLDELNDSEKPYIPQYFRSNSFVTREDLERNGFVIVHLPIFPTEKTVLFAVKEDKVPELRYAHHIRKLDILEYIDDIEEKEDCFVLPSYIATKHQLTPLNMTQILDILPNTYMEFSDKIKRIDSFEQDLINIEKTRTFLNDFKKKKNFLQLINFIEDNIN